MQTAETNLATAEDQAHAITAAVQPQITAARQDLTSQQQQEKADYQAAQANPAQFTLGIYGAWGSGKSSLLMAVAQQLKGSPDVLPLFFDAV